MAFIRKAQTGQKITYTVLLDDQVTVSHTVVLDKVAGQCQIHFTLPWSLIGVLTWQEYAAQIEAGNTIVA